jgi:hypothetical protein
MVTGYGIGGYGEGGYGVGAPEYDRENIFNRKAIDFVSANWSNYGITIDERSNTYALMRALTSQSDRMDKDLSVVRQARHIETAVGKEVERLGKIVSVSRRDGESDERLKKRIVLAFYAARTTCAFDEFARFTINILETNFDDVRFWNDFEQQHATIFVSAYPETYDRSPFTRDEITEYLESVVPAGHRVNLRERGTFIVKKTAWEDDPSRGLTSESIETGGRLASTIEA